MSPLLEILFFPRLRRSTGNAKVPISLKNPADGRNRVFLQNLEVDIERFDPLDGDDEISRMGIKDPQAQVLIDVNHIPAPSLACQKSLLPGKFDHSEFGKIGVLQLGR